MSSSTKEYFENFSPSYSMHNIASVVSYLKHRKHINTILDIGSGDGGAISILKKETGADVYGIEEAVSYRKNLSDEITEKVFWISILDDNKIKKISKKFDIILISRVLHHLVSSSPANSIILAQKALDNAASLLASDGELIIVEPVFSPVFMNKFLFYLKKNVSRLTKRRVTIFGYWNNIGEPLVNYLSMNELKKITDKYKTVESKYLQCKTPMFIRLFFKRSEVFLAIKKTD